MKVTDGMLGANGEPVQVTEIRSRKIEIVAADGSLWTLTDSDEGLSVQASPYHGAMLKLHPHSHNSIGLENTAKDGEAEPDFKRKNR